MVGRLICAIMYTQSICCSVHCIQYLNTNLSLYNAVMKAEGDRHLLSSEAQRAAHCLRLDFEKGGIHLCNGTHSVTCIPEFGQFDV